ncbi:hypothetical protein [Natrinema thermotolerans]|uniref:hypothetical protein n=1 Tax=Natrinema thermotolerans TaxID=121872 RepID=UPI000678818D|nr:hypothetical protein [Natrinema thermotolerans]QCC57261.1 hypothetical protein DVR14_00885 [Natrinema thermotolerans]
MSVFCLELDLASPPASSDEYMHLDGPLSYAAGVESIGHDGLDQLEDGGEPEYFADEMPLARYESGDEWVWACSAAAIAREPDGSMRTEQEWHTSRWRSRFDDEPQHQAKQTQVATSSGPYKAYDAALPYVETDTLVFLYEPAPDADPLRVPALLEAHVPHIGKKGSQGYGMIRDMHLYDVSDTVESAIYNDGRVLRSLPASFADRVIAGVHMQRRTTKPPYWHAHNQNMAFAPFTEIDRERLADLLEPATVAAE